MTADLLARLEKATGPDREIDHAIALEIGLSFPKWPPFYTESIDSALTLVPEGCATSVDFPGGHVTIFLTDGDDLDVDGATPALAICIAAMKARAGKE